MKMLAKAGIATLSADDQAHACIRRGKPAYHAVLRSFGGQILDRDREIDRKALGRLVFADRKARRRLERIVHPHVVRALRRFIRDYPGVIALDIPLLFEARLRQLVDKAIVVYCSREQQIHRLCHRDELSRREALQRMNAQMPLSAKCAQADWVILNTGSRAQLKIQTENLLKKCLTSKRRQV